MGIVSSNKPATFSPIYKSLHASNISVKLSVVSLAVNRLMPLTVVNLLNLSLRANLSFVMLVLLKILSLSITVMLLY